MGTPNRPGAHQIFMFINTFLGLSLVAPCWDTLALLLFFKKFCRTESFCFVAVDVSVHDRSSHAAAVGMAMQFLILSVLSQAISH